MSGSYRCIILAFFGWLTLVGNAQPIGDDAGRQLSAAQDYENSPKNSKVAAGVSRIGDALEAQNAKSDRYEKERNEREIRDLQAQEKSAYWAEAMFWATVCALILSVIGIVLVWTTFRETRKATQIMKDDIELRYHPRLVPSIEGPVFGPKEVSPREGADFALPISATIKITNTSDAIADIYGFDVFVKAAIHLPKQYEMMVQIGKGDIFYLHDIIENPVSKEMSITRLGLCFANNKTVSDVMTNVIFVCRVFYSDKLSIKRELGFAFTTFLPTLATFERYGGTEHNYDRKINEFPKKWQQI